MVKLAVRHPQLVDKLVLAASPVDDGTAGSFAPPEGDWVAGFIEALKKKDVEQVMANFIPVIVSGPGTEHLVKQTLERCLALPPETIFSFFSRDAETDIKPLLGQVRTPTLVTHGTADNLVPLRVGHFIAENIPDARFHAFEGGGHIFMQTATGEFCEVLRQFVRTETVSGNG
jgi:pimeloyl-ACP methyl ester carboxylesterase